MEGASTSMAGAVLTIESPWTTPVLAPFRGAIVTLGNFDGVHRGHQDLLKRARTLAGPQRKLIAATFDPHPRFLLRPLETGPPLLTLERKAQKLLAAGADRVVVFRIDRHFLQLSAQKFFDDIIVGVLGASFLVEGTNFCFGKAREGTVHLLGSMCERSGIGLSLHDGICEQGEWVSTSRIREKIEKGDLEGAEAMLGSPVELTGKVAHGARRGRTIGFPTANLEVAGQLVPAHGVYAAQAVLDDGRVFAAAVNVGPNPTFGELAVKIEAYLIGFEGDLYGQSIRLEFRERLRELCAFASADALKEQLQKDVARAAARFAGQIPKHFASAAKNREELPS